MKASWFGQEEENNENVPIGSFVLEFILCAAFGGLDFVRAKSLVASQISEKRETVAILRLLLSIALALVLWWHKY